VKTVVQRVSHAKVVVAGETIGAIEKGILALIGFTHSDARSDVDVSIEKICNLRIFPDDAGKMNLSLKEVNGSLLLVSQFTLYGDCSKGRRPSFIEAMRPEKAAPLYHYAIDKARSILGEGRIATGEFGADMQLDFCNDGPITLFI
jgi:D-aminoacyl-tRNA deacylase